MSLEEVNEFVDSLNTEQFGGIMDFFKTITKTQTSNRCCKSKNKEKNEVILEDFDIFSITFHMIIYIITIKLIL